MGFALPDCSFISVVTSHCIYIYTQSCLGVSVGPLLSVRRNIWTHPKVRLPFCKGLAKILSYSRNAGGPESSQISRATFVWSQEAQRCPWLAAVPSSSLHPESRMCILAFLAILLSLCCSEVALSHSRGGNLSLLSCTLCLEVLNTRKTSNRWQTKLFPASKHQQYFIQSWITTSFQKSTLFPSF